MIASPVTVIARQVLREAWRRRTLPVLAVFGCGIIIATAFLSFFQLGTEIKFFKDVAIAVIFLFGAMATLVLVATQLPGEIESRTIYNVLSKPIRRYQLVLGKFAGSIAAIGIAVAPMVTYSRLAAGAAQAFYYLLPNFENFNVRMAVVHNEIVPWPYLLRTTLYAAALSAFFLYLGTQVFEEREF